MNNQPVIVRPQNCTAPEIGHLLTAYCFGRAEEVERKLVEAHLLECECCWREVRRLGAAVRVLDTDSTLADSLTSTDVAKAFGISGRLDWPLGGHRWHAQAASAFYAGLFGVALLGEVAYEFDRYGLKAVAAAAAFFAWMFLTSLAGLRADWRLTLRGSNKGLAASMAILSLAALALYAAARLVLPPVPITQMNSLQAYPAQAAYLKDIIYFLILMVVFLLPPFHFVLRMQRELQAGRHRMAFELLSGGRLSIAPRGIFFPRFWVLLVFFVVIVIVSIYLHTNLMNHLKPAPYMNLFSNLILTRLLLYYALAAECLFWYSQALNELKRECLAAERIPFQGLGG